MSSKKAQRRKRRETESQERRSKRNPVTIFLVSIGAALILAVAGALVLGVGSGPGDPPFPGATWSAEHGHWH